MKTASVLTYYGGKANLAKKIVALIPPHVQYVEPFFGSGVVLFTKPPSTNEVINDIDGRMTNFFWQLKTNYEELNKLIQATCHSEILYKESKVVLEDKNESDLRRAWALWVQTSMTFSSMIHGGFAFGTTGCGSTTAARRAKFTKNMSDRLSVAEIFNRTATEIIELKDNEETFFFVDPPYVSSAQGHYEGYTEADFLNLLNCLQNIKGKFLLTSYPEPSLLQYREMLSVENIGDSGWRAKDEEQTVTVTGKREGLKKKIECMTFNYEPPAQQQVLFEDDEMESESLADRADRLMNGDAPETEVPLPIIES